MARNHNALRSLFLVLVAATVVAAVLLSLASCSEATAAPRLLKHSDPAATATATATPAATQTPMVYYPQGCRCCWFIWKPMIRCGDVCCGDGCTCN